jgi:hypothetical protein
MDRYVTVILNGNKVIDNQPLLGCTGGGLWSDVSQVNPIAGLRRVTGFEADFGQAERILLADEVFLPAREFGKKVRKEVNLLRQLQFARTVGRRNEQDPILGSRKQRMFINDVKRTFAWAAAFFNAAEPTELHAAEPIQRIVQPTELHAAEPIQRIVQPTELHAAEPIQRIVQPTELHAAEPTELHAAEPIQRIVQPTELHATKPIQRVVQPAQQHIARSLQRVIWPVGFHAIESVHGVVQPAQQHIARSLQRVIRPVGFHAIEPVHGVVQPAQQHIARSLHRVVESAGYCAVQRCAGRDGRKACRQAVARGAVIPGRGGQ